MRCKAIAVFLAHRAVLLKFADRLVVDIKNRLKRVFEVNYIQGSEVDNGDKIVSGFTHLHDAGECCPSGSWLQRTASRRWACENGLKREFRRVDFAYCTNVGCDVRHQAGMAKEA